MERRRSHLLLPWPAQRHLLKMNMDQMLPPSFPMDVAEFIVRAEQFRAELKEIKRRTALPDAQWYPFESLSALPIIVDLISPCFNEIARAATSSPIADIGSGDGDVAMLLARFGACVDAIDCARNNFNKLVGAHTLVRSLDLPVQIHDIDLDYMTDFPRLEYGFAFFLGALYHLKSPYCLLERLAFRSHWCLLSTRIAQVTPRAQTRFETEPLVYLPDGREIENDPTNYWVFSPFALMQSCREHAGRYLGGAASGALRHPIRLIGTRTSECSSWPKAGYIIRDSRSAQLPDGTRSNRTLGNGPQRLFRWTSSCPWNVMYRGSPSQRSSHSSWS